MINAFRLKKVWEIHRRSKRYGRSGFGRTTFWPMTTPTITSTLCACSEFFNRGHLVTSEPCRCFVGEMDCVIPSQPHQPPASFTFPKRSFGLFFAVFSMLNWFKQWTTFFHYDEAKDLVYCYTCLLCFKEKRLRSANADPAFVSSLNYVNNLIGLQERLNYLMLLHVHSDKTDKLD